MKSSMTKAPRIHLLLVSALLLLLLAACGGGAEATPEPPAATVAPATVAPTDAPQAPEQATEAPAAEASADHPASIVVAVNAAFKPFIYMDETGKMVGFDLDLMNALSSAGGFEVGFA